MLSSYDINLPLINLRTEHLYSRNDPLGFRKNFRYEFDLEVFDIIGTESHCQIRKGDQVIKSGANYHDYGRLGDSRKDAVEDALESWKTLKGTGIDVIVTTKLTLQPAFHDPDRPCFYDNSVRCFHLPHFWPRQDAERPGVPLHPEPVNYVIWQNGQACADGYILDQRLAEAVRGDIGAGYRDGELRGARDFDAYLPATTVHEEPRP